MPGPRVAVVGGGVAGLAAAAALAPDHEVVLLEADGRLGGKLLTGELLGRPLDLGPDSFVTRDPTALERCRDLGLEEALVAPGGAGAALFANGALRPLPPGLVLGIPTDLRGLWRSGAVPRASVLRAAADLILPGRAVPARLAELAGSGGPDPTVAEVVGRRLGREVLQTLVDPLLGGINAGDAADLSFLSAAPGPAGRASGRRSLMAALRPARGAGAPAERPGGVPLFLGLAGGIGRLGEALAGAARDLGAELRTGWRATALHRPERSGGRWRIEAGPGAAGTLEEEVDGVVLAVPAFAAAELLGPVEPELAAACGSIPYAGVATLTLTWPEAAVPPSVAAALAPLARPGATGAAARLPGNGVLLPRTGDRLVTAATFTSTKWPSSAAPGQVVVRASVGRHRDGRALELDDRALEARVLAELEGLLGITAAPEARVLQRWPRSFPQYVSGHRARVAEVARLAAALPAIALVGAAYEGIGIPACLASGMRGAALVAGDLAGRASPTP